MRLIGVIALVFGMLAVPSLAAAQHGDDSNQKPKTYDFEDDEVNGTLIKPGGSQIDGRTHGKTSSLIKVRSDFIHKMRSTVDDL